MTVSTESAPDHSKTETPPPGTFKSIIPCTPLAVVKTLEHAGVYNKLLPYGDRFRDIRRLLHRYIGSRGQLDRLAPFADTVHGETRRFLLRLLDEPERFIEHIRK